MTGSQGILLQKTCWTGCCFAYLSLCVYLSLCLSVSVCVSVCLSVCPCVLVDGVLVWLAYPTTSLCCRSLLPLRSDLDVSSAGTTLLRVRAALSHISTGYSAGSHLWPVWSVGRCLCGSACYSLHQCHLSTACCGSGRGGRREQWQPVNQIRPSLVKMWCGGSPSRKPWMLTYRNVLWIRCWDCRPTQFSATTCFWMLHESCIRWWHFCYLCATFSGFSWWWNLNHTVQRTRCCDWWICIAVYTPRINTYQIDAKPSINWCCTGCSNDRSQFAQNVLYYVKISWHEAAD